MEIQFSPLIPAKAGTQSSRRGVWLWVPAFAGMSGIIVLGAD